MKNIHVFGYPYKDTGKMYAATPEELSLTELELPNGIKCIAIERIDEETFFNAIGNQFRACYPHSYRHFHYSFKPLVF